ncbi:hypothetical protein ABMA28_008637 [Loxostege sticticalis]|uniref:Max-binding protein MNT n=1 Tax=Loxostege sticticalis TaxID=481309 RepID=A0ABD0SE34_LOXSC
MVAWREHAQDRAEEPLRQQPQPIARLQQGQSNSSILIAAWSLNLQHSVLIAGPKQKQLLDTAGILVFGKLKFYGTFWGRYVESPADKSQPKAGVEQLLESMVFQSPGQQTPKPAGRVLRGKSWLKPRCAACRVTGRGEGAGGGACIRSPAAAMASIAHAPCYVAATRAAIGPPRRSRDSRARTPLARSGGGHVRAGGARGQSRRDSGRARTARGSAASDMSLLDTLLEAARFIELQERRLQAEEEPKSPVSVCVVTGLPVPVSAVPVAALPARSNGVVRLPSSPAPCAPAAPADPVPAPVAAPAPIDFIQEHSRPRTTSSSHGPPQIPSPPSVSSNGSGSSSSSSAPRAGTREVHNKLEKNRRAHLKECFELLKRHLPATPDDKKTSNLSILGSAIRYIQVLRRKERECEHEMERLAREKIAAQQRLAALKREVSVRASVRPRSIDPTSEDKDRDETVNNQVVGIPISITSSPPRSVTRMEASPPHSLNLSTKLRTLPIQITPTTSQVVRTSYGSRHNTLTLTTLAPADGPTQNGQTVENGVTNALSTAIVHPAQIHLPLSQVVGSGGLVVGPAALQLLSAGGGLRVLQAPAVHTNGVTGDSNRTPKENGLVSPPVSTGGSVMVSGLTPIVVSQPAHLLQTHTLTHKMVETQMVKGSVAPLTVSAQYLSTTIVKPVVVVSAAHTPPPAPLPHHPPPS